MPTRADMEFATPRCVAEWPAAMEVEESKNLGLAGGTLIRPEIVLEHCLKLMRYRRVEALWRWVCECGATHDPTEYS